MFNVSLIAFNANGCTDTLTKQALVELGPPVISGFSHLPIGGCIPITVNPIANITSPDSVVFYDWDFGDGTHDKAAEPTHVYNRAGYYNVALAVKTASGCSGTDTVFRAVVGGAFPPVADFSVSDTNVCGNTPVQFSPIAIAGTITSWYWEFGDKTVRTSGQNITHYYSVPGRYTITLYVSDKGCGSHVQKRNYILVKPPFAKIQTIYSCTDRLRVDFKDQSIQPQTWKWDFGDGDSSINQNVTHIYDQSGAYHVKLTTTNSSCTNTTDTMITVINANPQITITPAGGGVCRNDNVAISTNDTTYISDYLWNLANGITLFGDSKVKFTYTNNGTFDPCLVVNYVNGCKDTTALNQSIHVYGPTAGFNSPSMACLNNAVTFTDTSHIDGIHTITTWKWNSGENEMTQPTAAPFSHTYITSSMYTPTLKITDAFGCTDSVATAVPLTVKGAAASFDLTADSSSCDSVLYRFTNQSAQSNDVITQYKWSFGDGDSAFVKDPQHYYTQNLSAGQVGLTVVSASGCTDTAVEHIAVNITGLPKVAVNIPKEICLHEPVQFTATQTGQVKISGWLWNFGDGATSSGQNTTYTYNAPSSYEVKLIAQSSTRCADTIAQQITVNPLPTINVGDDILICAGKTANLSAAGADTYSWQPLAGLSCSACAAPIVAPPVTTRYYITGVDGNGCANEDSVIVRVQQREELSVQNNSLALCAGDAVMLAASGSDLYQWQPAIGLSDPVIANPVARPPATTIYTVTATDENHCFSSSKMINVVVNTKPTFNITDTVLIMNKGATQQLQTNSSADIATWLWQPQQGLNCYTCATPTVTASQPLTYVATVTTAAGCTATDMVRIAVLCDAASVYVPSAFTPNGDGKNDRFYPLATGGTAQQIKLFEIFTNTGQRIFARQNIYTNSYADGWDGTYKSHLLGENVFIYKMEVECNGEIIAFMGTVAVIR